MLATRGSHLKTKSRRAFTLLEIVVTCALLAIFVGVTALSLRQSIHQAGPQGMAHALAADLRSARAEAQRRGCLVAVCLPCDDGATPVSRSFTLRSGEQIGDALRIRSFDRDFEAGIFVGSWPGSALDPSPGPVDWSPVTQQEYLVYFRPDGTMFTSGLPLVDGRLPLVVASNVTYQAAGDGFFAPQAVATPQTVWVDGSGAIEVVENQAPAQLPSTAAPLVVAAAPSATALASKSPSISDIKFLPSSNPALSSVGLSQTYIEIHPEQKEGDDLEYGLATMVLEAIDEDGGPLFFEVESEATAGDRGRFTVFQDEGRMSFIDGKWRASVSWRPPPGAAADTEYEFEVAVKDKDGNRVATTSGAGLLPSVTALVPSRLAVESSNNLVYVGNIDGGDLVRITPLSQNDQDPFFSPDGTKLYTFNSTGSDTVLVQQNGDGTNRRIVNPLPVSVGSIRFDPLFMWGSFVHSKRVLVHSYTITTTDSDGNSTTETVTVTQNVNALAILHLSSGKSWDISKVAIGNLSWDSLTRFGFRFSEAETVDGPPGIEIKGRTAHLVGFPPTAETISLPPETPGYVYNLKDPSWWVRYAPGDAYTPSKLLLENGTQSHTLRTNLNLAGSPAWSGDGQWLTYLHDAGAGRYDLLVQHVFNGSFGYTGSTAELILDDVPISSPKLSPDGKFVFFLRGDHLFRIEAKRGATAVKLSDTLPGVKSFALSR